MRVPPPKPPRNESAPTVEPSSIQPRSDNAHVGVFGFCVCCAVVRLWSNWLGCLTSTELIGVQVPVGAFFFFVPHTLPKFTFFVVFVLVFAAFCPMCVVCGFARRLHVLLKCNCQGGVGRNICFTCLTPSIEDGGAIREDSLVFNNDPFDGLFKVDIVDVTCSMCDWKGGPAMDSYTFYREPGAASLRNMKDTFDCPHKHLGCAVRATKYVPLLEHLASECKFKKVKCPQCSAVIFGKAETYVDLLDEHVTQECQNLRCPTCDTVGPFSQIQRCVFHHDLPHTAITHSQVADRLRQFYSNVPDGVDEKEIEDFYYIVAQQEDMVERLTKANHTVPEPFPELPSLDISQPVNSSQSPELPDFQLNASPISPRFDMED